MRLNREIEAVSAIFHKIRPTRPPRGKEYNVYRREMKERVCRSEGWRIGISNKKPELIHRASWATREAVTVGVSVQRG